MSADYAGKSTEELNSETREVWNANAAFWDEHMGEGNSFQRFLIGPATEELLGLQPGELVLDIGCGNGSFSRRMSGLGARVVALDFSDRFIERAIEKSAEHGDHIEYHVIDATDEAQLMSLGEKRFDAAVSTMAMMDMASIEPLSRALSKLLKPAGRFVFSITHPCFNNGSVTKVVEEEDRDGEIITTYAVKVARYMTPFTTKGLGVIGQPAAQYYFHRPLSHYLSIFFNDGFVLDGLAERAFSGEAQPGRPFPWANFHETPPVLVVRMRNA
jgi:2-polyprenyl-3-methyl-5-hydroxy-6-metoxy-1,4-benzoquinol methylase